MSIIRKRDYGFSLLELLAVMSIMGLLTTVAVTSYFSAARGMARRAAVKHLVNSLTLARQRACMDNARVSVVMYNEISGVEDDGSGGTRTALIPSYVVCKEIGKITMVDKPYLVDEFNSLDAMFSIIPLPNASNYRGGFRVYNLSEGGFSFVFPWVKNMALASRITGRNSPYKPRPVVDQRINAWAFEINRNVPVRENGDVWNVGDSYGVEAAPVQMLPQKYQITYLGDDERKVLVVTFQPDGRRLQTRNSQNSITIEETRAPYAKSRIDISQDGKISYTDKWN